MASFLSSFKHNAKKLYHAGKHHAKKAYNSFHGGARKVRAFAGGVQKLIKEVSEVAPVVSEVVDELTDLIPFVGPIKKGSKIALSAFNTIGNLAGKVNERTAQAQVKAERLERRIGDIGRSETGRRLNNFFSN